MTGGTVPVTGDQSKPAKIVLISGTVKTPDKVGHHDYLAGCTLAAFLLEQTSGVSVTAVRDGWPEDDGVFDAARSLVFYTGGVDKHAFLKSAQRLERIQRLIDQGAPCAADETVLKGHLTPRGSKGTWAFWRLLRRLRRLAAS